MESINQNEPLIAEQKKKYDNISQDIRMAFIRRVQSKKATIKQAAKEFGIKFSTSKAILQTYRREGRIGKKKTRERQRTQKEEKKPQISQKQQDQRLSNTTFQSVDEQIKSLQNQLLNQIQVMQLGFALNPFYLMSQQCTDFNNRNQILNSYLMNLQTQQMMNQHQQLLLQQNQSQIFNPVQFGMIKEKQVYETPLQSYKNLDSKYDEGRTTLKDFN